MSNQTDDQKDTDQNPDETVNTDTDVKPQEEMTTDEIKAEAERLEAENKTLKDTSKDNQIHTDQLKRLTKAQAKNADLKDSPKPEEKSTEEEKQEVSVDDQITLREQKFAKDSDQAKLLKQYKDAGLIKDYQSGLEDAGVMAKMEAINASNDAKNVIDKNDNEDSNLTTKRDMVAKYESTGEVPTDKEQQKDLAQHNLEKMGIS